MKVRCILMSHMATVYNDLGNIMFSLNKGYNSKIYNQDKYNLYMDYLDNLVNEYKIIYDKIKICKTILLNGKVKSEYDNYITNISNKLRKVWQNVGSISIYHLLDLVFECSNKIQNEIDHDSIYFKLLDFYNRCFMPISCHMYMKEDNNVWLIQDVESLECDNNNKTDIIPDRYYSHPNYTLPLFEELQSKHTIRYI